MNTLDLTAAAAFLGMRPETLRERAAYFRSQCRSISAPVRRTGGSTSVTLAADGEWFRVGETTLRLDGHFTAAQLRKMADILDRYPKDEP